MKIVVGDPHVYVLDDGRVYRISLDGTTRRRRLIAGGPFRDFAVKRDSIGELWIAIDSHGHILVAREGSMWTAVS